MGERVSGWLITLASLGVPRGERARFLREWRAELWHEARRPAAGRLSLLRHALGAFPGAAAMRGVSGGGSSDGRGFVGWWLEARLAVRSLWRAPGFTGVAVLTLALGMGGASAIYTLLDRIVLDPLPYPESDRLVELMNQVPGVSEDAVWNASTAQYVFFRERAESLEDVGIFRGFGANVVTTEGPERVLGWRATPSVFSMLAARATLGRSIGAADVVPGAAAVVALSHDFWRRALGSDPAIIGQTLRLNGQPVEVVGVMAAGVRMPGTPYGVEADLWAPFPVDPAGPFANSHVFPMIGRLAPGVEADAAETELERLTRELPARFPAVYSERFFERYGFRTQVTPLKEAVVGEMSRALWILFGAVGLVLVLACANVANLFVVRLESRRRELAIRSALGAGRGALSRLLLAEGLTLSLAGGLLALLVSFLGVPALVALAPEVLPRAEAVAMDGATVGFTLLLSLVVGAAVAAYPLLRDAGAAPAEALAAEGRSAGASRERQRLRSTLVVGQVALALTVVVGAGLLVESLNRLREVDTGIEPAGALTARLYLPHDVYDTDIASWRAHADILARIRAIPGVTAAGMSQLLPVASGFGCTVQGFEDAAVHHRIEAAGRTACAGQSMTAPGYFEALGIPVVAGRALTDADNLDPSRGAVVVSRTFADRFWPGEDPIGKGVAPYGRNEPPFYHVVGVVGDVPARDLTGEPATAIYYPLVKHPDTPGRWGWHPSLDMYLVVRTTESDPAAIFPAVRRAIRAVDPDIPISDVRPMERIIADATARQAFTALLLAIAALVALALAAVGLYGVVAYLVGRRTREIGIRIALGARPGAVQRRFLVRSLTLVAAGLVLGTALALATTRLLESFLFGVQPTDPTAFAAAAAVLAGIALLATWIPARRAARVDPVEALRE